MMIRSHCSTIIVRTYSGGTDIAPTNQILATYFSVSYSYNIKYLSDFRSGFDFEIFTSILKTKTGNTYYFVYDYGYMEIENEQYVLVKKEV